MIQNVLRAIGGIGVYDTISICLFVAMFSGVLMWAARMKRSKLNELSVLPLHDGTVAQEGESRHE